MLPHLDARRAGGHLHGWRGCHVGDADAVRRDERVDLFPRLVPLLPLERARVARHLAVAGLGVASAGVRGRDVDAVIERGRSSGEPEGAACAACARPGAVGVMRRQRLHVALVAMSLALMATHVVTTGRMDKAGGLGWDGQGYARMLNDLGEGTANMRLRPAIVLANRPAYWILREPVATFVFMNYIYLAVLVLALALLADRYGIGPAAKVYLIATVGVSIATAQMFAYYPALLDLGAYAVIALALYCIVRGWHLAAA